MPDPRLPKNAKKVFTGKLFEVYQWPQKMFDGSTETFERVKRPDTVEIIATAGNKIIIEEQSQPHRHNAITLPSGRADKSRNMLAEAKRELLEETGYKSNDWQLWQVVHPHDKVVWDIHYFIARDCKLAKRPELDPGEKIETRLIKFEELLDLADEPRFWVGEWFISELLRMRLDPKKKQAFRKLLFGKKRVE